MDFLKSFAGGDDEKPEVKSHHDGEKPAATAHHSGEKHTKAELFASAKVVADSAKSAMSGGSDKVDKGKAAGAASDLVDGADEYGKLTDKGYGSYVDKAQGFLHKYESQGPAKPSDHKEEKKTDGHDGAGAGDYLKMAQGFLGK